MERLDISQIEREAAEGQEVEPPVGRGGGGSIQSPLPLDQLLAQGDGAGRNFAYLKRFQRYHKETVYVISSDPSIKEIHSRFKTFNEYKCERYRRLSPFKGFKLIENYQFSDRNTRTFS